MNQNEWPTALTTRIASELRTARKAAGLTMGDLAQGCADRGLPDISEQSIKNLESGRKTTMTIADFLVMADVLGVPPVTLLFPLATTPTTEVLPGREVPTWDALAWFTGETPLDQPPPDGSPREILDTFRGHSDLAAAAKASTALATERRRQATTTLDPARRTALLQRANDYEEHAFQDCAELRAYRARIRERGLAPPALNSELAHVDAPEPQPEDHA